MNQVKRIFLNADFRKQHDGLIQLAQEHHLNIAALEPGEHVVFVNSQRNKIKMFSHGQVLSYLRLTSGKVDLETLQAIPRAFKGNLTLAYDKALTKMVVKKLKL